MEMYIFAAAKVDDDIFDDNRMKDITRTLMITEWRT